MAGCGAAKDDRPISGGGGASPGGCATVEDVVVRLSTVEGCWRVLEWISDSSENGLVFRLVANARSAATARIMAQRK